jgi:hypothetical protein
MEFSADSRMKRAISALLWGLLGVLSFGVLIQGYYLLIGPMNISLGILGIIGVLIGVVVAGIAYVIELRLSKFQA